MEAVILIGLQGAGKSTFCRDWRTTHVRINLTC
jgi:predicted kinase